MQSIFKRLPYKTRLRQQPCATSSWRSCRSEYNTGALAARCEAQRGLLQLSYSLRDTCTRQHAASRAERQRGRCKVAVQELQEVLEAPKSLTLHPGEVHVWWTRSEEVRSAALQDQYLRLLPTTEREYVLQGATPDVRKERLLARILVRLTLARYCHGDVAPSQLCFESSPSGKPWLVREQACTLEGRHLHFNLTHTDELLGVAVSRERFVGLDVESTTRLTKVDPLRLARRRFSEREIAVLEGFGNSRERAALFMRLWTLKEAYVKATGRGISAAPGLKAFTFELLLQTSAPAARREPADGKRHPRDATLPDGPAASAPGRPVARLRLPFRIRFAAAPGDAAAWEAVLMDVSGGHTAALVVEARPSGSGADGADPLRVRVFKTVPLVSEEEADEHEYRVIGYGMSSA